MKNKDHPIDNLFREKLDDHRMEPSGSARAAFLRDAAALPPARSKYRGTMILFALVVVLTILGIFSWHFISNSEPSGVAASVNTDQKPSGTTAAVSAPQVSTPQTSENVAQTENPVQTVSDNSSAIAIAKTTQPTLKNQNSIVQDQKTESAGNVANTPVSAVRIENHDNNPVNDLQETQPPADPITVVNPQSPVTAAIVPQPIPELPKNEIKVTDTVLSPLIPSSKGSKYNKKTKNDFIPSIGVYYTPEWMFNTLEGSKFINNFGLEGIFSYGPFSIRTGAGLSIGKGTNELKIEYQDYLGTYNKLDSMKFQWNGSAQKYVPTYFLSSKNVYDSLLKLENARVVKRYTYLQIPLNFGYDFYRSGRFSAGFRIGPILSVLLTTKQLSEAYDPGKNKIIQINDISPGQVNLNWQIMAGLNTAIRLNDEWKIELEPSVRYYFNSVYEKPANSAKPWSIGIRAAITTKFW